MNNKNKFTDEKLNLKKRKGRGFIHRIRKYVYFKYEDKVSEVLDEKKVYYESKRDPFKKNIITKKNNACYYRGPYTYDWYVPDLDK